MRLPLRRAEQAASAASGSETGPIAWSQSPPGYPVTVDLFALLAESKIRTAMVRGEFDNLPGHGRPLQHEDCSRVPADLRLGFKLLRNAGCLPPELEARKEVTRLGTLIAATGDPEERAQLSRLRADAELRYQLLVEHRQL